MLSTLHKLSIRLKREVEYSCKFYIPFLRINERWVLTESLDNRQLELNDLQSYTWEKIQEEDLLTFLDGQKRVTLP